MLRSDRVPQVEVRSAAEWRDWLLARHGQEESLWLVTWKKRPGAPHVSRHEAMDEALCFGWVDGIMRRIDEARVMQLFSPRRHQRWTAMYRARAAVLIEAGRMHPAGLAAIERARAEGGWEALPEVEALLVPQDLRGVLAAHPPALERFEGAAPSCRRNVLRWIALAKRPETRAKRLLTLALHAAEGRKLPQM